VGKLSTSSAPVYVGVLYQPWSNQGAKASMSHGCSGHPRMPFSDSDKPVDSFVLVRAGVWVAARGENAPVDSPESLRGIPMRGAAWVIPKDSSRCHLPEAALRHPVFAPRGSSRAGAIGL
jgi:hypothetical protein